MTVITLHDALGEYGALTDFINLASLALTRADTGSITLTDKNGATVEFQGTGFLREGNSITAGTITGVSLNTVDGTALITFEKAHLAAASLWPDSGDFAGLTRMYKRLTPGNDLYIGSNLGDEMGDIGGKNVFRGRGGDDYIYVSNGNNRMTGGSGSDSFVFVRTKEPGHDVITDFHATGKPANHDHIVLFEQDYNDMTLEQIGSDVLLSFARGGDVLLKNVDLADLDNSDFLQL